MPAEPTSFLDVDLDLYSAEPLDGFVAAMGEKVAVLFVGRERRRYSAHLELSRGRHDQSADRIILGLVRLIETLPPSKRALWNKASLRQFNIGIAAGKKPNAFELSISDKAVEAIARVRGELVITVYAPDSRVVQPSYCMVESVR